MRRNAMSFAVLAIVVSATFPAVADEDLPTVVRSYAFDVKSGHDEDFQAAMKKQVEWYRTHGESWAWHTWQMETGDRFGQYVFRSPNHRWKDIDERSERSAKARAHFMETVGSHLESLTASIGKVLPGLSRWPAEPGMVPMVSVHEFKIRHGMAEEFIHTIGKIHEAIEDANWPVHYGWSVTVSGGEVPTFWLVIPMNGWTDMQGPEKPFRAMLAESMGPAGSDAILASLRECVREERSAIARYRPELSYVPSE